MLFWGFRRYRILHTLHSSFLPFETPCVVCSLNFDEVKEHFKFFGCHLVLMVFVVSSMFLIPLLILLLLILLLILLLSCSIIQVVLDYLIFLWIPLGCFCCALWHMPRILIVIISRIIYLATAKVSWLFVVIPKLVFLHYRVYYSAGKRENIWSSMSCLNIVKWPIRYQSSLLQYCPWTIINIR